MDLAQWADFGESNWTRILAWEIKNEPFDLLDTLF